MFWVRVRVRVRVCLYLCLRAYVQVQPFFEGTHSGKKIEVRKSGSTEKVFAAGSACDESSQTEQVRTCIMYVLHQLISYMYVLRRELSVEEPAAKIPAREVSSEDLLSHEFTIPLLSQESISSFEFSQGEDMDFQWDQVGWAVCLRECVYVHTCTLCVCVCRLQKRMTCWRRTAQ